MALRMTANCQQLTELNLTQPQVRDLAWACLGPPLLRLEALQPGGGVTDVRLPLTAARAAWLHELDRQPQPLIDWLEAQQGTRLGLYFERLWHFFLTHDSETELLAHNLPVRSGGQTLGEFDCLYYCRAREQPVHLELAVKFYLGWRRTTTGAEQSSAAEWLGPNPVDRLDLKLQRLLQHQSRLSLDPVGRGLLASRGLAQPLREIALRGSLFQPARDLLSPPAGYNPALRLPHWYTLTAWRSLAEAGNRFVVLPRLRWLSPLLHSTDSMPPETLFAQLQARFSQGGRPVLVVQVNEQGCECQRFFLAGSRWPEG